MMRLLVLGGGPAGLFCAVSAAELRPGLEVVVLEREAEPLRRLRPGRGHLSLTRLLPPEELLRGYPRGAEAMEGWLHVWQARDTQAWFASREVPMDVLPGGALVPGPNAGERAREGVAGAARLGVRIHCSTSVAEAAATSDGFRVWAKDGPPHDGDFLLLATGGQGGGLGYGIAQHFGHSIVPALPRSRSCKPAMPACENCTAGCARRLGADSELGWRRRGREPAAAGARRPRDPGVDEPGGARPGRTGLRVPSGGQLGQPSGWRPAHSATARDTGCAPQAERCGGSPTRYTPTPVGAPGRCRRHRG
jgi:hypothetical protein